MTVLQSRINTRDAAFAANEISYAKTRTLTRWADEDNEQQLLDLAHHPKALIRKGASWPNW